MAADLQALTIHLTRLLLVSSFFFSLSGLVSGVLQGHERFLLPTIAPLVYNGAIIVAALLPGADVERLVWGVIAGSVLHLAVQLPGLRASRFIYQWTLGLREAAVRQVLRLTGPRLLGLIVSQLHFVLGTVLATLLGPGNLSALSYAWVILMMPIGVFGMALATAFFPTMVQQGAADEREALGTTTAGSLRLVLFMSIPSAVGLFLLSQPIVAALFQRGEFTAAATATTAAALAAYAIGLPGHAALEVLTRAFYSVRDTTTPFLIAVLGLAMNLLVSVALMTPLGVTGLALGASIAAMVEAVIASVLLWRAIGPWAGMSSLYRVGLSAAGMAVPLVLLRAVSMHNRAGKQPCWLG
jgi:putative peptidoglycan lipid II flippase